MTCDGSRMNDCLVYDAVRDLLQQFKETIDARLKNVEKTQVEMRDSIKANERRAQDFQVLREYVDMQKAKELKWQNRREKIAGLLIVKIIAGILFVLGWLGGKVLDYAAQHGWFQHGPSP